MEDAAFVVLVLGLVAISCAYWLIKLWIERKYPR